jgi:hypothetical protein
VSFVLLIQASGEKKFNLLFVLPARIRFIFVLKRMFFAYINPLKRRKVSQEYERMLKLDTDTFVCIAQHAFNDFELREPDIVSYMEKRLKENVLVEYLSKIELGRHYKITITRDEFVDLLFSIPFKIIRYSLYYNDITNEV